MRISSSYISQLFLASQNQQEAALAQTQQQISTGLQFNTPAQNPSAATQVLGLNATLSQITQYGANANLAQNRLSIEDTTLSSVINVLQSVRSLALQGANATADASTRATLAAQIQSDSQSLLQLANTQDGNGQYLFAGTATTTPPFSQTGGGVSYAGTQNQRFIQVGNGVQIADSDSGARVFQQIPNGNGSFVVGAGAANTGSAIIGENSVTNPAAWNAGSPPYAVTFATPSTYTVTDSTGASVAAGSYTDGSTIAFNGAQLTLGGTPAAGDTFTVAKSTNQDVFTTLQNLVGALKSSGANSQTAAVNTINRAIEALDQAQGNVSLVQAQVGSRLQTIDAQTSTNSNLSLHVQSTVSGLQDLNYASAATTLNQQITALQAAQQSFARIKGLSLFNYIQ
jgi:flagellar hook-associated protein 3 FlgL